MTDFEFVDDLPPITRANNNYKRALVVFAEALRANPGRWAKYPVAVKFPGSYANNINNGKIPSMRGCQAASRGGDLYVRWPAP